MTDKFLEKRDDKPRRKRGEEPFTISCNYKKEFKALAIPKSVYVTGEFFAGYSAKLNPIVDALFIRESASEGVPGHAGIRLNSTVEELANLCSDFPDAKMADVVNVIEIFRKRSYVGNHILSGRSTSLWLNSIMELLLNKTHPDIPEYDISAPWSKISLIWDNGTASIDVDGNVATVTNCGSYARYILATKAGLDNFGIFASDKFAFAYEQGAHLDANIQAMCHCTVDSTEIPWKLK